jgi:hypothetical protein
VVFPIEDADIMWTIAKHMFLVDGAEWRGRGLEGAWIGVKCGFVSVSVPVAD